VQHQSTDNIERKAYTSHNKNQDRVVNMVGSQEPLDRLEKDANTQGHEEGAVETSTNDWRSLPAERIWAIQRFLPFFDL